MEFKLTINDGPKSYKYVIKEPEANVLLGMKIGEKVKGDSIGLKGYELEITGGSDNAGFPMHKGVQGAGRGKYLKRLKNGALKRKTVMGNTISESISQINLKVVKKGEKELSEIFKKEETEAGATQS